MTDRDLDLQDLPSLKRMVMELRAENARLINEKAMWKQIADLFWRNLRDWV